MTTPTPVTFADNCARATRRWEPLASGRKSSSIFLFLHGMESHAGWFDDVGKAVAARGYCAVAYDRLGWGASGGVRGDLRRGDDALAECLLAHGALLPDDQPCHVVGMSWGALPAALHAALSVTLLAPAIFPTRRLSAVDYLKVAASAGGFPSSVALPLTPADFTHHREKQTFVRQDSLRVQRVAARFLLATWQLQRTVRQVGACAPTRSLLLAGDDQLIDNKQTAAFGRHHGFTTYTRADAAHSLVLEDPQWVVDHLIRTAERAEATL